MRVPGTELFTRFSARYAEYVELLDNIRATRTRQTAADLETLTDKIIAQTNAPSTDALNLLGNLIQLVNVSRGIKDEERGPLEARIARHALNIGELSSAQRVLGFAGHLPLIQWGTDAEWERERRSDVELMLRLLAANVGRIDPAFNENELKYVKFASVPVPQIGFADWYPAGIEPSAVRDPAQRKAYEERLELSRQEHVKYDQQRNARELDRDLRAQIVRFVKSAYVAPPNRAEEVAELFDKYSFVPPEGEDVIAQLRKDIEFVERVKRDRDARNERVRKLQQGITP